jgi:hypothetical protein
MKKLFRICCYSGLLLAAASCQKDANLTNEPAALQYHAVMANGQRVSNVTTSFTVTVENVSTPGTLNTPRLGGIVPLSPGAWAVFNGNDPMFTEGQMADLGTERIGEDGTPFTKNAEMATLSRVRAHGIFKTAAGPILPGQSAQFSFDAHPGERLQFENMFVQSNDWFYSFSGKKGLQLFSGNTPVTGDVTSALGLYDAGTEEDTPPGYGPAQKPVQPTNNFGPSESVVITEARVRHPEFTIPANNAVIRVTITVN